MDGQTNRIAISISRVNVLTRYKNYTIEKGGGPPRSWISQ